MSRLSAALTIAFVALTAMPEAVADARLGNISTRAHTGTGDQIVIAGFIIEGDAPKEVLVTARGPGLADFGVSGVLADTELVLFSGSTVLEANDSWQEHPRSGDMPTALQPGNPAEAAILRTLEPGAYTAHLLGTGATTGISIVEVWEVGETSRLINISTRAGVGTGDSVMIGGLVANGDDDITVVIRARGPSLSEAGVTGVLSNPSLEIYSGPTLIDHNDDWSSHARAADIPESLQPTEAAEATVLMTVAPGPYTAIVRGVGGATGIGIVEVFEAAPRDTDADGLPNSVDPNDDNDPLDDDEDAFPLDPSEWIDTDGDGIGNNADPDDDDDRVEDLDDAFPLDASESVDTDGDGIGNNADPDDDNDGVPDGNDPEPLNPLVSMTSPTGLGGLWTGSMQATTGSSGTHQIRAISTADGSLRLYSEESFQTFVVGMSAGPGQSFTASGDAYPEFDLKWADGSRRSQTTLNGTLIPADSLFGTWTNESGDGGTFSLDYNPDYENPPGLSGLAGRWRSLDEDGTEIAIVTVQSNGNFTGEGGFGCELFGALYDIDPTYNAYRVLVSTSGCTGNSGTFTGLGTRVSQQKFILTIQDGSFAVINELRR